MGPEDDDTDELTARARAGDDAAWAGLVDRYSALLWAIARAHGLGDADAGDAVQTTWLRLVERIDTLRDPSATGRWLAATARRESRRLAAARRAPLPGPVPSTPSALGPDQVVLARDRVARVAAALQALPHRCRVLLRLSAVAPTQAALAAALQIPPGSVGPTRQRCLMSLRRLTRER
ncbi:RNA polymerase sigma factor [Spirillospora albida]|uniref:RNA polymerase sigma factor n=1 Tax=Spirillospora albida TaxID=58123 RepID=UPI0004BF9C3A|nr:sigma-70 family RNA polymerase sigma factor [Spirillospora albida]